jgi:Ca-activated chloride channel family protein
LRQATDSGGTELGVALEQALGLERAAGELARHVLVLTDAEVTDGGRILRLAQQEVRRGDRRRISVLCIDAAPNSLLAVELAEQGGGVAHFLTSQPEEEDITTALDEVLADWAEPVLTGLRLEVNRGRVEAAGRAVVGAAEAGWSAVDLGDLPAGRPVWVAGRVPRGETPGLVFRLRTARPGALPSQQLDLRHEADARPALKALFGVRRVRGLEYLVHSGATGDELGEQLLRLGYDPATALAGPAARPARVYAENARADVEAALRGLLAREALEYGLASAETAFVAVRSEAGQPVDETVIVANALPSGWSARFSGGLGGKLLSGGFTGGFACLAAPPLPAASHAFRSASVGGVHYDLGGSSAASQEPPTESGILFDGVPSFGQGEAILFDSARDQDGSRLPGPATFVRLEVRFPDGTPGAGSLDAQLCLLLFVDDPAVPRARVRLVDLVRQRGERPLNLSRAPGQLLRLVLVDPSGSWKQGAPRLEVTLTWRA